MGSNTIQRMGFAYGFSPNPFYLALPVDATIVALQFRRDEPTIWYTCDGHNQTIAKRVFEWVVTDGHVDDSAVYVGTLQEYATDYHLFELRKR